MSWFFTMLFGCVHRHCTFPISIGKPGAGVATYIVCLDCGKEFPYDWEQMKVVASDKHKKRAVASIPIAHA